MTLRVAADPALWPRESAKVKTVAKMLDTDESQIRRLVDAGELEAHRIGKRGIRIYLDSVADYKDSQRAARPENGGFADACEEKVRRQRINITRAAHRSALVSLRQKGIL